MCLALDEIPEVETSFNLKVLTIWVVLLFSLVSFSFSRSWSIYL